jgi:ATP-dependent RNA helicase DDX3X
MSHRIFWLTRPHLLTLRRLRYMVIDEADEIIDTDWEEEFQQNPHR